MLSREAGLGAALDASLRRRAPFHCIRLVFLLAYRNVPSGSLGVEFAPTELAWRPVVAQRRILGRSRLEVLRAERAGVLVLRLVGGRHGLAELQALHLPLGHLLRIDGFFLCLRPRAEPAFLLLADSEGPRILLTEALVTLFDQSLVPFLFPVFGAYAQVNSHLVLSVLFQT